MEELSIEEKAKAYDELIEKLRDFYRDYDTISHLIDVKEELANLIPELAESEDEKIKETLIKFFSHGVEYNSSTNGIYDKDIVAWLEKQQGEQNPTDNDMIEALRTEYEKGRADAIAEMQVAWSEEDESILQGIWDEILANKHHAKEYEWKTYDKFLNWLKSLTTRCAWKPSEIQLQCLYDAIEHYQTNGYPASKLNELYEQMSNIYKL